MSSLTALLRPRRGAQLAGLLLLASACVVGQEVLRNLPPPPPDASDFKVSSDVEVVMLDVSVKDSEGGWVSGLAKENFQVFEDGKPVELRYFAKQDEPVTVGLIVDGSGSIGPKRPEVITAALSFAMASNKQDEMFVVGFNDAVYMGLPKGTEFTDNHHMLRTALLAIPIQGRTALYDAIALGLTHLEKGRKDKKTLVVVSDGGDNASERTFDQVIRLAEESAATIYTVGIFAPDAKDKNPGVLKRLAHLTGGEVFLTDGREQLVPICQKIAADIRNRYALGFSPTISQHDGKARKLRVVATGADGKRYAVRTRTEYLATAQRGEPALDAGKRGK